MDQVEIFVSYAEKDWPLVEELVERLQKLRRYNPSLRVWYEGDMLPGEGLEDELYKHLKDAKIILVLLSPRLLKTKKYELSLIEAKRRFETAHIIPVLLRPTNVRRTVFAEMQILPEIQKPISGWVSPNLAYFEVILAVEKVVEELTEKNKQVNEGILPQRWTGFF